MSDDLTTDALWQMADDLECWFPSHNMARFADAMRDVAKERDGLTDELTRLRADVERLTASLAAEVEESERLRVVLSDERRHGDELAAVLANVEYMSRSHAADDLLDKHRARRQG